MCLSGIYPSGFSPQLSFILMLSVRLSSFFMVFTINFMTSSDILYSLRQSIIYLCVTISYAFFKLTHVIATFSSSYFALLEDVLIVVYSRSPVPLVPLLRPFCSAAYQRVVNPFNLQLNIVLVRVNLPENASAFSPPPEFILQLIPFSSFSWHLLLSL